MADRRDTYRQALEAEGASAEEIAETLAEVEAEATGRDPHARARRAGVPPLYLGVGFDDIELDDRREAIMVARNWSVATVPRQGPSEVEKRRESRQPPPLTGRTPEDRHAELLERIARGDRSTPIPCGLYLWSAGDASDDLTGFGTGKTRIAAAAAQHLLAAGLRVRWLDVVRLMTDLNLSYRHPMYERAAHRLREPAPGEVVVLDDIDKQPPTDRNIQPIFALVNGCVNGETPLLITANRSPDDLQDDWGDRFGHAAASRIIGHCLDVEVRGRDRRLDPA